MSKRKLTAVERALLQYSLDETNRLRPPHQQHGMPKIERWWRGRTDAERDEDLLEWQAMHPDPQFVTPGLAYAARVEDGVPVPVKTDLVKTALDLSAAGEILLPAPMHLVEGVVAKPPPEVVEAIHAKEADAAVGTVEAATGVDARDYPLATKVRQDRPTPSLGPQAPAERQFDLRMLKAYRVHKNASNPKARPVGMNEVKRWWAELDPETREAQRETWRKAIAEIRADGGHEKILAKEKARRERPRNPWVRLTRWIGSVYRRISARLSARRRDQ